jgi:hypothetical protein
MTLIAPHRSNWEVRIWCLRPVTNSMTYLNWARTWNRSRTRRTGLLSKLNMKKTKDSARSNHISIIIQQRMLQIQFWMKRKAQEALRTWEVLRNQLRECRRQERGRMRSSTSKPLEDSLRTKTYRRKVLSLLLCLHKLERKLENNLVI